MDRHDLAILREMTRDHHLVWGGIDPRVSTTDIADRVGLHPSTVRARLRAWEREGFLEGYDVIPNPGLLGCDLMVTSVRMEAPEEKAAFFDDLGLVEGVHGAIDHVGPWVGVAFQVEHPPAVPRRVEVLGRRPGVGEVEEPFPGEFPRAEATPSSLDWRIVRELRRDPTDTLAAIADRVGITPKTLKRRYHDLVRGHAIVTVAVLDFRRYTGGTAVRVNAYLADPGDRANVAGALRDSYPEAMEMNPVPRSEPSDPSGTHGRVVQFLVHVSTAAVADDLLATASQVPGVAEAEVLFPVRYHRYPQWLDERVDRLASGTPAAEDR